MQKVAKKCGGTNDSFTFLFDCTTILNIKDVVFFSEYNIVIIFMVIPIKFASALGNAVGWGL